MKKQLFERIASEVLETGFIPFNIYFPRSRERLALLCKAGKDLNERHLRLIRDCGNHVFIKSSDRDSFINYAQDRLSMVISDPRITARDTARMVHMTISRATQAITNYPTDPDVYVLSRRAAKYLVELIETTPSAVSELFEMNESEPYTYSHSLNVSILAVLLGRKLFYSHTEKIEQLALAGLWHDSGKMQVRKEIIYKRGFYSTEEREEAERHVFHSERIMRAHSMPEDVCLAGRNHHERWDGTGYPDGLTGKMIPYFARIIAVADTYDAITSNKVYKSAKSELKALMEMARDANALDGRIFNTLLEIVLQNDQLIDEFRQKAGIAVQDSTTQSSLTSTETVADFQLPIGN